MVRLLAQRPAATPLLLVLDDGRWFDSASWVLAERAARVVPSCVLLLATRPMDPEPAAFVRLATMPGAARVRLAALGGDLVEELLRDRLEPPRRPGPRAVRAGPLGRQPVLRRADPVVAPRARGRRGGGRAMRGGGGRGPARRGEPRPSSRGSSPAASTFCARRSSSPSGGECRGTVVPRACGRGRDPIAGERPQIPAHLGEMTRRDRSSSSARWPSRRTSFVTSSCRRSPTTCCFPQRAGLHRSVARWIEERYAATRRRTSASSPPLGRGRRRRALDPLPRAGRHQALRNFQP